jgi:hypothetical protein
MRKPVAEGGPGVCIEDVERRGATVQTFSDEDVSVLAANFETLFSQVEDPVLKSCLTPPGEDVNGAFACMVSRQVKPEWWPHLMIDFNSFGLGWKAGQPHVPQLPAARVHLLCGVWASFSRRRCPACRCTTWATGRLSGRVARVV